MDTLILPDFSECFLNNYIFKGLHTHTFQHNLNFLNYKLSKRNPFYDSDLLKMSIHLFNKYLLSAYVPHAKLFKALGIHK